MKRLYLAMLIATMFFTSFSNINANEINMADDNEIIIKFNEDKLALIKSMGIEAVLDENKIVLVDKSQDSIARANEKVTAIGNKSRISYPTPYYPMYNYFPVYSKKFKAASKSGFQGAVTAFLTSNGVVAPATVAIGFAIGFGSYYFQNSDTETLYMRVEYHYSQQGPDYFLPSGTLAANVKIRKIESCSKYSNFPSGSTQKTTRYKSEIGLYPF